MSLDSAILTGSSSLLGWGCPGLHDLLCQIDALLSSLECKTCDIMPHRFLPNGKLSGWQFEPLRVSLSHLGLCPIADGLQSLPT